MTTNILHFGYFFSPNISVGSHTHTHKHTNTYSQSHSLYIIAHIYINALNNDFNQILMQFWIYQNVLSKSLIYEN
jgi:hypothetical protein